jgi:hypothetical protein
LRFVALRIEIDEEDLEVLERERLRQVDCGGGFSDAALLIRDCDVSFTTGPVAA